ncbi:MAG: PorV/PorQ family protein [candidate division WOR-3 bacterium]|nr:PorV/PorQ family protein [candidate division WOR-3 bacterium]
MKSNKILRILVSAIIISLIGVSISEAKIKFSKVGTTSAQFLKIGVGRATGMGEAFTAIADDASASYFNPAGLTQLGKREFFVNHIDWISDINHDYLCAALPITNIGVLALSVTALTMGDMEKLTIDDPATAIREDDSTGLYFGAMDLAFGLTFARQITEKLSFGLTAKAINQTLYNLSASGAALDFGLLYFTGFKSLRLGAAITNFGTSLTYSGIAIQFQDTTFALKPRAQYLTTPTPLPVTFRFGIAYDILDNPANRLTFACDLLHPNDINETINFGLEYNYRKVFFLRGGYILNTDLEYAQAIKYTTGLSFGAGFMTNLTPGVTLRLDYCYRDMGWLKGSHRLGAIVGL